MKRRRVPTPSLPYQNASSGARAAEAIKKVLKSIGASSVAVMDEIDKAEVVVQFTLRGQPVMIRVPAKGYAAMWLRRNPYSYRMRISQADYERKALEKGHIAVYSMLRDWINGQVTAIEIGMFSFEGAFLGQIMLPTGETVWERVERNNILSLSHPSATH